MYRSKLNGARQGRLGALADINNASHGLYLMALTQRSGTYGSTYMIGMRIYSADALRQIIREATTYLMSLEGTNETDQNDGPIGQVRNSDLEIQSDVA